MDDVKWVKNGNKYEYTTKSTKFIVLKDGNRWTCNVVNAGKTWVSWSWAKTLRELTAHVEAVAELT